MRLSNAHGAHVATRRRMSFSVWTSLTLLLLVLILWSPNRSEAISSAECGSISSPKLVAAFGDTPFSLLVDGFQQCATARRIVTAYLAQFPRDFHGCSDYPCDRHRVKAWNCELTYVHGALTACAPLSAPLSGPKVRKLIVVLR